MKIIKENAALVFIGTSNLLIRPDKVQYGIQGFLCQNFGIFFSVQKNSAGRQYCPVIGLDLFQHFPFLKGLQTSPLCYSTKSFIRSYGDIENNIRLREIPIEILLHDFAGRGRFLDIALIGRRGVKVTVLQNEAVLSFPDIFTHVPGPVRQEHFQPFIAAVFFVVLHPGTDDPAFRAVCWLLELDNFVKCCPAGFVVHGQSQRFFEKRGFPGSVYPFKNAETSHKLFLLKTTGRKAEKETIMTDSLFSQSASAPLPARMRPETWDNFAGQKELVGRLKSTPIHSMILYGPPGCGKTTLARLLAKNSDMPFEELSAVSSGVKDVRETIDRGRRQKRVLFIDEIHRFSKSQQDALLGAVESGIIILIGATTENPSFEVIGPLLSRCFVYRLTALTRSDISEILDRALIGDASLSHLEISPEARSLLIESSAGDARKLLSTLELCASLRLDGLIESETLSNLLQGRVRSYDKAGENHFDFISAFIKSLRGSDPDAALIYMACMLEAGEDPLFIARRMVIFASEDIGNAAPQALQTAVSAFLALERIGMPEGRIVLSQASNFLASCPKSNASYSAIESALEKVKNRKIQIPDHLRNAPTDTHRQEGAGKGYLYPHDFPGHYAEQNYMPPGFEKDQFYFPTVEGQEGKLKDRLRGLKRPDRDYR